MSFVVKSGNFEKLKSSVSKRVVTVQHGERFGSSWMWSKPKHNVRLIFDDKTNSLSMVGFGGYPYNYYSGNGIWLRGEGSEHALRVLVQKKGSRSQAKTQPKTQPKTQTNAKGQKTPRKCSFCKKAGHTKRLCAEKSGRKVILK